MSSSHVNSSLRSRSRADCRPVNTSVETGKGGERTGESHKGGTGESHKNYTFICTRMVLYKHKQINTCIYMYM